MFGDQVTLYQAVIVCLFSITVVFLVLLSISFLIGLTAKLLNRKKAASPVQAIAAAAAPEPEPAAVPAEDSGEITAAITAAVAAYLGKNSSQFVVRSIRPVSGESDWSRISRTNSLQ
ncbi:MAG: OadG family protein [Solobacterium sp.]|nr:OadG family protein [Solobacterium sp.]MBR3128444.1 OadG family protein [Solobacterium sp.]